MTTLQFVDTHNLVMFLAKPAESGGFEQIVDSLNIHTIRYALTINPTIYTSCIEQFWATAKVKTVNGEVQLPALMDEKKIIVNEAFVRRDLQLNDEEGTDCLQNATIFEELTRMGTKTTAWNEFSSTMASAIICLATNQKFNFSKYIFKCMVKNLDNVGKFLMYPRFVQVFLDKQLEGMSSHKRIYVTPSHTKKIFRNMKRVGKGFFGRETPLFPTMVVQNQADMGEGLAIPTDPQHTPTIIQPSTSQPQRKQRPRKPTRKDTKIPQSSGPKDNVVDKTVNKEMDDSLERAATTATGLDTKQDRGNVDKTQSKATPNEPSSLGTSSGGGPRGNTLRSGKDRLKVQELMELCTNLQNRVISLQNIKTTQAQEITSLKLRVKKLEKKGGSRTHKLKRLYKVGRSARIVSSDEASLGDQEDASKHGRKIKDIDKDAKITLVDETHRRYGEDIMFDVSDLAGEEVFVAEQGVPDTLKSEKVQEKGDVIEEPSVPVSTVSASIKDSAATTTTATIPTPRKGIVFQELEPEKPIKKKELIRLDEEIASKLQAEFDEEAKIDADYQLAEQLQAKEQEELTIEEKSTLFKELLETRRKHFAAKRAEEKRNKPPTKVQQRSIMCTYLKNMEGHKHNTLKNKSFNAIQELFNKALKRVNIFEDFRIELVESSAKRAREELIQESAKKQKVNDDKEELKVCLEIVPDEEVIVDVVPLAVKLAPIGDLKTKFEPNVEDEIWRNQQGYTLLSWKLFDSYRVHSLMMDSVYIHMLVDRKYPPAPITLSRMWNGKLEVDYECEMAYELLRFIKSRLKRFVLLLLEEVTTASGS
ncbi:hypothetical protein Tco_1206730 [Tanacetum coccineum]